MKYAIIGGTGFEKLNLESSTKIVSTVYGEVELDIVSHKKADFIFLSRHGKDHSVAPHLVNYRANIEALKIMGVEYIYGICAVGSCNVSHITGDILLLNDFIDFTKSRVNTFYDGIVNPLKHVEMSNPYSTDLNILLKERLINKELKVKSKGVYVCTEGPRFETAAEIKFYSSIGADVVGMTNVPEVVLAKEKEINYSAVCYVTNLCTGLAEGNVEINYDFTNLKSGIIESIIDVFNSNEIDEIKSKTFFV